MATKYIRRQWTKRLLAKVRIGDLDESDAKCSICHQPFSRTLPTEDLELDVDPEVPVRLSCGHTFGKVCITRWLVSHLTCPICRCRPRGHSSARIRKLGNWRHERAEMRQRVRGGRIPELAETVAINSQAVEDNLGETYGVKISTERTRTILGFALIGIVVLIVGTLAFEKSRLSDLSLARTSHPCYLGPFDL